jgi:peptidoglycan/xylan/chitin deacetylase (PgdA/CDA1 family)
MKVTLTFDNGPSETTPGVLDALARRGVRATFFVLGRQLARPALASLARGAHASGHRIGNHSYNHRTPFGELADPRQAIAEIEETQTLIGDLAGEELFFRPFGGGGHIDRHLLNADAVRTLTHGGYTVALWTSVPRDWEDPHGWVDRALADCRARDWSVVVLHDLPSGAMDRLGDFLDALIAEGAEFSQAFPPDVTPIVRGQVTLPLKPITSDLEQPA